MKNTNKKQDAEKYVQLNLLRSRHNYGNLNQKDYVGTNEQQQSTSSSPSGGKISSPQSMRQENLRGAISR